MERWQFSVRSLLVLTAILSLVLAFAVNLPGLFKIMLIVAAPVLLIAAILQSANFATSDRRPRLAVLSWSLLGAFFAVYAVAIIRLLVQAGGDRVDGPLLGLAIMAICCLACAYHAYRSFMLIGRSGHDPGSELERAQSKAVPAEPRNE